MPRRDFQPGHYLDRALSVASERRLLADSYRKAQEVLSAEEVDPRDFKDLYGEEAVESDLAYVTDKKRAFNESDTEQDKELQRLAIILEAIIFEQVEQGEWLGPEAVTIKPSEYDDIANGVDSVVEFQREDNSASHLGLAFDVTFSQGQMDKKFGRIKAEIRRGALGRVKYFKSEFMDLRGELSMLPRVVVGMDLSNLKSLMSLWAHKERRALGQHPAQMLILEEILMQLEYFRGYAERSAPEESREKIVEVYSKRIDTIRKIHEEKARYLSMEDLEQDGVYKAMKRDL